MKAFVFGGTGTIGKEVVKRLVADGVREVVFTYHTNSEKAEELVKTFGERVLPVGYPQHRKYLNDVDIVVDAIGINIPGPFTKVTWEDINKVVSVNTVGMLERLQKSVDAIKTYGSIVIIGSSSVDTGGPTSVHYAASKNAIESAVRGAAIILGQHQARINELRVGYVDSPMGNNETAQGMVMQRTCLQQFIPPVAVAQAVSFLVSYNARYITGAVIKLDGGGLW